MSTSVCWELTCDGLVSHPGGTTLSKLEISTGSNEQLGSEKKLALEAILTETYAALNLTSLHKYFNYVVIS